MLLLLSLAMADEGSISAISEPIQITDDNGTWSRVFPAEGGGWHYFRTSGREYKHWFLDEDFVMDKDTELPLTGRNDLVDHAISPCPDGGWLHVASTNSTPGANDGAWVFRYNADLELLNSVQIASADNTTDYNDSPLLCSEGGNVGMFQPEEETGSDLSPVYRFSDDGTPTEVTTMTSVPPMGGASVLYEPETDSFLILRGAPTGPALFIDSMPADTLEYREHERITTWVGLVEQDNMYWPQGALRIGDLYYIAHMMKEENEGFQTDTGQVWVSVFDLDWTLLNSQQITQLEPPVGAMQPWISHRDGLIVITYMVDVKPFVQTAELDGYEGPVDTGGDTGDTGDTAVDPNNSPPIADAGGDAQGNAGEPVILESGSSDPDGDAITHTWRFTSVPEGSTLADANLAGAQSERAIFVPDVDGAYVLELLVSDGQAEASDAVTVTVGEDGCGGCSSGPTGGKALAVGALLILGVSLRRRKR